MVQKWAMQRAKAVTIYSQHTYVRQSQLRQPEQRHTIPKQSSRTSQPACAGFCVCIRLQWTRPEYNISKFLLLLHAIGLS